MADVIIVGGGLAGTYTAFEIAKAGHKVTLLRDGRGASPHIAGFNLPGAEEGDSPECFLEDTFKSACGQGDPALAEILCKGSARLKEELLEIGFSLDGSVRKSLGSAYARVVGKGNTTGADILAILDRLLEEGENVTILDHTRALRLFTDKGQISGVLAYDKKNEKLFSLPARCVLLACGGYAGIFPFSTNTKDMAGDGVAMGLLAGAHATDMEFVQFEPSGALGPEPIRGKGLITTLFYDGAVLTNGQGERFMLRYSPEGERVNKDILARRIAVELREGRGTPGGGVYFDCRGVDPARMHESYEHFFKRYQNIGINLLKEPVEVTNAAHTALGGMKVNENCETAVKGLYAIGEAMGNLHGANRLGGSAGSEVLVFPKHVTKAICKALPGLKEPEALPLPARAGAKISPARMEEIRQQSAALLERCAGVCREGAGLQAAALELEQLYKEVLASCCENILEQYSLENRLITALALIKSALLREDSIGCHWRLDKEQPPAERYRTEVFMENEQITVRKARG